MRVRLEVLAEEFVNGPDNGSQNVLERLLRAVAASSWDEAVASAYLHETEHWTGIKHASNPYRRESRT